MSELFHDTSKPQYFCWDRRNYDSIESNLAALKSSATVYVGNLSHTTTEVQIHEAFSVVGPINRIIMGLNMKTKEPCGFCFVEYFSREHALSALTVISTSVCDERVIRCDLDVGFIPGRQFGRGKTGGQRRDDFKESSVYNQNTSYRTNIPQRRQHRGGGHGSFNHRRMAYDRGNYYEGRPKSTDAKLLEGGLSAPRPPPPPGPHPSLLASSKAPVVPESDVTGSGESSEPVITSSEPLES